MIQFQRGLMALADVEGARIHLKQLTIAHHMTSWESFQEILVGHYTRQILHEMYKVRTGKHQFHLLFLLLICYSSHTIY